MPKTLTRIVLDEPKFSDTRDKALDDYITLKKMIKDLESELAELKPIVEDYIDESGRNTLIFRNKGTFFLSERTSWEYSAKLQKEIKLLKQKMTVEQILKVAVPKAITRVLTWRPQYE